MKFATSAMALIGSAAVSSAASVTFWTLDTVERTLVFTPNPECGQMESVVVNNQENTTVTFDDNWTGNWYAYQNGAENIPGMLGEVRFGGWNGLTYFDVSAIVQPGDHDNVKQMWPDIAKSPMSGCEVFPCDNAYWLPDDIQTKTTPEVDLWTTLGSGSPGIAFA